jgi:hypothetical protein
MGQRPSQPKPCATYAAALLAQYQLVANIQAKDATRGHQVILYHELLRKAAHECPDEFTNLDKARWDVWGNYFAIYEDDRPSTFEKSTDCRYIDDAAEYAKFETYSPDMVALINIMFGD